MLSLNDQEILLRNRKNLLLKNVLTENYCYSSEFSFLNIGSCEAIKSADVNNRPVVPTA